MRFGIFDHVERRTDVSLAQQFAQRLEYAHAADDAGFFCYHVAEHHNSPLCLAPNQAVYLSAVAQHTKNIRLSALVYVLPLHHPVRLIEEISMLDQISGGRFEVGVGRGTDRAQELRMWGGDAEENNARFDESLDVLVQGLQCEFLTHNGPYYQFKDLWMALRPMQQPVPPLWWPGNADHAGAWGMNFLAGGGTASDLRATMQRFRDAYAASDKKYLAGREEPLRGVVKRVFIGSTQESAQTRAKAAWDSYRSHFAKPLPGGRIDPDEIPIPAKVEYATAVAAESVLAGTVESVRDYVVRFAEEAGANYLVLSFQWGDITHEEAISSLGAFADKVIPAVA